MDLPTCQCPLVRQVLTRYCCPFVSYQALLAASSSELENLQASIRQLQEQSTALEAEVKADRDRLAATAKKIKQSQADARAEIDDLLPVYESATKSLLEHDVQGTW